ncbi:kinase-like domain-containing protein [Thelephora terrestris]|uniref:Kinase-like domain-containing protein n=1 Tax=Thelephora terrestris TaxID=56493 RepID=A0A9P6HFW6_9AGAM|nr:kinase-like domain-containing protein [Thelephora terrestris]
MTINDKYAAPLSGYCSRAWEALKNAFRGKNLGDFDEFEREDPERRVDQTQSPLLTTLNSPRVRPENVPCTNHNKENVDSHTGGVPSLCAMRPPPDVDECATTPVSESVRRRFDLQEPHSFINAILSSENREQTLRCLSESDAQNFIDAMDKALHAPDLLPCSPRQCLKLLYRTCGYYALLPRALQVQACYDRTSNALYRGGYADVWKGEHRGQDVAVKVIRMYSNDDLRRVINRFCKEVVMWRFLRHPNVLPLIGASMSENRFAMVSEWMPYNMNQYVEEYPEVNRLELLAGVAQGLIYLHENGMVHGDLKGANILIDGSGQARLADFGLVTIVSDPANLFFPSSCAQSGTVRWMSPELIDPDHCGFERSRPTKSSDCYALGMVIYETISGKLPYHEYTDLTVFLKVAKGERPRREASLFKDSLWKMLERDMPSI